MFHFHKWGKWQVVEETEIVRRWPSGRGTVVGTLVRQKRVCEKCGFTQHNQQRMFVNGYGVR